MNNSLKKYYQYSIERFKLSQFGALSLILALCSGIATQTYLFGKIIDLWGIFVTFFALFLFLLRLRFFDEFKDHEHDCEHYQDRPVPRGLITLKEITVATWIVIGSEIMLGMYQGWNSMMFFIIMFCYSALMFKEFFVPKWLKTHFTAYILSHEIILIPLYWYLFSLNGFLPNQIETPFFWYLIGFLFCQFFLLEIARKMRPKELEIPSKDTYTAQYGIVGASIIVSSLAFATLIFQFLTENYLVSNSFISCGISLLIFILFLFNVIKFTEKPTQKTAKNVFGTSILFVVLADIAFVIHILGAKIL